MGRPCEFSRWRIADFLMEGSFILTVTGFRRLWGKFERSLPMKHVRDVRRLYLSGEWEEFNYY
jgi:hypothetical protein